MRNGGGAAELNKERKVYIESQSKRILERRGVDTTDGVEGGLEGPRRAPEEVRGLEGLVQGLGGDDAMDTS
jgi:kinetochore protein Mis12/MTW1